MASDRVRAVELGKTPGIAPCREGLPVRLLHHVHLEGLVRGVLDVDSYRCRSREREPAHLRSTETRHGDLVAGVDRMRLRLRGARRSTRTTQREERDQD